MASSIAEYLRQSRYIQEGGKPEGQRDIDKINAVFGNISSLTKNYVDQRNAGQTAKLNELKMREAEATLKKTQGENQFVAATEGLPSLSEVPQRREAIAGASAVAPLTSEQSKVAYDYTHPRESEIASRGYDPYSVTNAQRKELAATRATEALYGQRQAQTAAIPTRLDIERGRLLVHRNRAERMFPVSALSPEGQDAARRAGMPDFIPESHARIINGANPIKLPSAEETTSLATAGSIADKINQVSTLLPYVGDKALGFGNYQINKWGQYVPGFSSDPQIVDFYTNINSINNAMIYYMSGKQINEQESKRIKSELLEPELNPDAFQARLQSVVNNFEYLRGLKDQAVTGTGKRNPFGGVRQQEAISQPQSVPQFQVGQTTQKNGKTYTYIGNNQWQAK